MLRRQYGRQPLQQWQVIWENRPCARSALITRRGDDWLHIPEWRKIIRAHPEQVDVGYKQGGEYLLWLTGFGISTLLTAN